ncbi:MAG TPA: peptide chain release factor 1 [Actinomycetota bacterium]|nr:peptide chain release factor 1 [Actinomycetota bacterium]
MNAQVRERLEGIERRFEELGAELSLPETAADPAKLRGLGKQHAELEPVVRAFRAYRGAAAQAEEGLALAKGEADPDMAEYFRTEADQAAARAAELERELEILLLPKDPNDDRNVIIEIRAGTGGDEAALFAGELLEMYRRFAERHRWKTEVLSSNPSDLGGVKEVVLAARGDRAFSRMKHEAGVHRVQRVPVTESGGRIHTSTATVAVLPEAEETEVDIKRDELQIDVFRSSGPGGQSVNTTDSAVRVTHRPTGIVVSVQEERSQMQNRDKAMRYLRARLLQLAQREAAAKEAAARSAQVGTGERSEKIRTYNFPQNRVTDHRIGLTVHNLPDVLAGNLDPFVDALMANERAEQLGRQNGEG